MPRTVGFLLLSLLALGLSLRPPPALAKSATTPRSIETTGTASISADPDRARIVVGVSSKGVTGKEAAEATAQKMREVVATLKKLVGEAGKVATRSYTLQPEYTYPDKNSRLRKISGYLATNTVTAETKDLDSVGTLIDAVVAGGANQVQGVSFFLADETEIRRRALIAAGDIARAEAQAIAESLQVELGPVLHATTVPRYDLPRPSAVRHMALSEDASPTEILPGEVQVSATVQVSFALR
jgi:uncharacterized protein YggE